jgi:hypothetical protein
LQACQAFGQYGRVVGTKSYVAQLAARAGFFAVEVEMGTRDPEHMAGVGQRPDEVEHG